MAFVGYYSHHKLLVPKLLVLHANKVLGQSELDWGETLVNLKVTEALIFTMDDVHMQYEACTRLTKAQSPEKPDNLKAVVKTYQQLVGALMWAATITRPDIAFVTVHPGQCALFMANPGPEHVAAEKRILKYLKTYKHLKLTYTRSDERGNVLYAYADADHAGDPHGEASWAPS